MLSMYKLGSFFYFLSIRRAQGENKSAITENNGGTKSGGSTLHFVLHLSLSVQTHSCFPLALVFFASRSTNKLKGAARIMLPTLLTFQ